MATYWGPPFVLDLFEFICGLYELLFHLAAVVFVYLEDVKQAQSLIGAIFEIPLRRYGLGFSGQPLKAVLKLPDAGFQDVLATVHFRRSLSWLMVHSTRVPTPSSFSTWG